MPKVRASRLCAITMDTYMNRENDAVTTPGPYAALSSIAIPPDVGFAAEYFA